MQSLNVNLTKLVNIHLGKNYKLVEGGTVPVYNIGSSPGFTDQSICDVSCIAIGAAGTIGRPRKYEPPYWISSTQIYLTAKTGVDLDFIWQVLSDEIDWDYMTSRYSVIPSLCLEEFQELEIECPNVDIQKAIGRLFVLRQKTKQNISAVLKQFDVLQKDVFYAMFGDPSLAMKDDLIPQEELYDLKDDLKGA